MRCKILKTIQKVCDILELLLKSGNTAEFLIFLEDMFSLVVGIEFIKMLCRPSADNVIEVLIFLTARHPAYDCGRKLIPGYFPLSAQRGPALRRALRPAFDETQNRKRRRGNAA